MNNLLRFPIISIQYSVECKGMPKLFIFHYFIHSLSLFRLFIILVIVHKRYIWRMKNFAYLFLIFIKPNHRLWQHHNKYNFVQIKIFLRCFRSWLCNILGKCLKKNELFAWIKHLVIYYDLSQILMIKKTIFFL